MYAFTAMKGTSWNAVIVLWTRPWRKESRFLAKQKSNYWWLKPMTEGHNAKTSTQRLTCSSCKGNHPTPLHGYIRNKTSKTDGNQTVDGGGNLKNNSTGFNNDLKWARMTGKTGFKMDNSSQASFSW